MDESPPIGDQAPDFELPDLAGEPHRLSEQLGRLVVLNFWSDSCPHSARGDQVLDELQVDWGDQVVVWRIASNANESIERLRAVAAERQLAPVLIDGEQAVADQYGALTTPHVYLIGKHGRLRYAGALDDVNLRVREPSVNYLQQAVSAVRSGQDPDPTETRPFGCTLVRHPLTQA